LVFLRDRSGLWYASAIGGSCDLGATSRTLFPATGELCDLRSALPYPRRQRRQTKLARVPTCRKRAKHTREGRPALASTQEANQARQRARRRSLVEMSCPGGRRTIIEHRLESSCAQDACCNKALRGSIESVLSAVAYEISFSIRHFSTLD
jgi:hypothetical protein